MKPMPDEGRTDEGLPMLDLNPDTVYFVIDKAREFHAKEEVVIPEDPVNSSGDWGAQVLADHIGDLGLAEVKGIIDDLDPDQQVCLVALMWLGRGDYEPDNWSEALNDAGESWNERTSDYLLATPLVADYLDEAMDQMGYTRG
jgi:hypothetical protein